VTARSIYEVPLVLEQSGLGDFVIQRLGLPATAAPDLSDWRAMVEKMCQPKEPLPIASSANTSSCKMLT